jgi:SAM-dependent methyltransferase
MRFDACAHSYDAHAAPQRAFATRVAEFIGPCPEESVVEFGAGTGALTEHLRAATSGASLLATDASVRMVALGQIRVPSAKWEQLDAFCAPLPQAQLQVSSGLLQWAGDPVEVLRRWRAALRPEGRLVHAVACEPCLAEWRSLVRESPVVWRDAESWLRLFIAAGLRVQRHQLWVEQMTFPSALDMLRSWHESGVTGKAHLGAGKLRGAMRLYHERFAAGSGVTATWAWLVIEASRA